MVLPQTPEQEVLLRKYALRWALVFLVLIGAMGVVLWWSGKALSFGAARIQSTTHATYKLYGVVNDSSTGRPVAWAEVEDDPALRPPRFRASADYQGKFEFVTLADPHKIVVHALGYKPKVLTVGKDWYLWMPKGEERLRIELEPE